jgi:hypothetical protein
MNESIRIHGGGNVYHVPSFLPRTSREAEFAALWLGSSPEFDVEWALQNTGVFSVAYSQLILSGYSGFVATDWLATSVGISHKLRGAMIEYCFVGHVSNSFDM